MFSICENNCVINFNLNDYIVLKLNSKLGFLELVLKRGPVTGLGPDYIIPGLWPELSLLALRFRQELFLPLM